MQFNTNIDIPTLTIAQIDNNADAKSVYHNWNNLNYAVNRSSQPHPFHWFWWHEYIDDIDPMLLLI